MPSDRLYDLAFEFRKTKLWKRLLDTELFALQHSDGTIGYCCIMGMIGEHLALGVYPGEEGLNTYRMLGADNTGMSEFELREKALSQNCVMCSFENKAELRPKELEEVNAYCDVRGIAMRGKCAYPKFQRFRPRYYPWYLKDETDEAHLAEALEACLAVSKRLAKTAPKELGFTEGAPFERCIPLLERRGDTYVWGELPLPAPKPVSYPTPKLADDISLKRAAKSKRNGSDWACDVFMHLFPMSDEEAEAGFVEEPENAPFYPYIFIVVDNEDGRIIHVDVSPDLETSAEQFARELVSLMEDNGVPSRILVCNERTEALLAQLSKQIGVKLSQRKRIPFLEEAEQSFIEHFDDDDDDDDDDDVLGLMLSILNNPDALDSLPNGMLRQFLDIAVAQELPEEIVFKIMKECKRRRLR